jgi:hypothetical protein
MTRGHVFYYKVFNYDQKGAEEKRGRSVFIFLFLKQQLLWFAKIPSGAKTSLLQYLCKTIC